VDETLLGRGDAFFFFDEFLNFGDLAVCQYFSLSWGLRWDGGGEGVMFTWSEPSTLSSISLPVSVRTL
jgi:hypothetical protein